MHMRELARAKINLSLHVTGRRADGYHLLDSLVVFPQIGDLIEVEPANGVSLTLAGPFAQDLSADADNLVLRAAEAIRPAGKGAAIHLTKSLPVASGIGGGSADAAATLRALSRLWDVSIDGELALSLGADVPVCLESRPMRMRGIGEELTPFDMPDGLWIILVNPGVPVSTPDVFGALRSHDRATIEPRSGDFVGWLAGQRNDLQAGAVELQPVIGDVLDALSVQPDCALARMSGSGATCFGLFMGQTAALDARAEIAAAHPLWWCVAAPLGSGDARHDEISQI